MYWEEKSEEKQFDISDDVIDLSFKMHCKSLPLDHAYSLSTALIDAAPWLAETQYTAIHLIHGAESGNGWNRPEDTQNEILHLSRRARFTLRVHKSQLELANKLLGLRLDIDGHPLGLDSFKQQTLVPQPTVFARYVKTDATIDEDTFLNSLAPAITALGVNIKKMMGGKPHTLRTPNGDIHTRSLMLSDLEKEESIALQQNGTGDHQLMGMGIFLPHKGITAVKTLHESLPPMPE